MTEPMKSVLAALCLLLSGCSLAPDYIRPPLPVPEAWPQDAAAGKRSIAEIDWQSFFPDPRLRALIGAALDNNRDLRIATARIAEARAQFGIQRADRFPTVNLGGDRNASLTPGDLSFTRQPLGQQRYDVNLGVTAFELDFWGRVKNLSEAALRSYLATEEARRAFRLSLIADVADAYLTIQEMDERAALARETVRTRQEFRDLTLRRRDAGIVGDLDALGADGALQNSRVVLGSLERQGAAADNLLRLLVGELPKELPAGRRLVDQDIDPDLAAGLPSEMLLRRPDVLAAEQTLIAANANIGAARAAFFPRLSLTGAFGTASASLSGLFDSGSKAWNFQPVLSMPIFDAGRVAGNVDLTEARKVIAVAQYEKAIQQAFREVADLLVARDTLRRQLDAQEAGEKSQTSRLRLVEARYQGGIVNHFELLDAQRDAFVAQQDAVQLRRQLLSAYSQIYKALGGGLDGGATATQSPQGK